jgi:hypothetical protein
MSAGLTARAETADIAVRNSEAPSSPLRETKHPGFRVAVESVMNDKGEMQTTVAPS